MTGVGAANELRARHRAYYLRLAEETAPHLYGAQTQRHLARLASDHENLRSALTNFGHAAVANKRSSDADALEGGARLCVALFEFWTVRGFCVEGRDFCERFLQLSQSHSADAPLPGDLRADLLRATGALEGYLSEFASARSRLNDALILDRAAQNHRGASDALACLGIVTKHEGNEKAALALFEESLVCAQTGQSERATATALNHIAQLTPDKARQAALYEECVALCRDVGDIRGIAQALASLAWLKQTMGEYEVALPLYEESRTLRQALNDQHGLGWLLRGMAISAISSGDRAKARACYEEALGIFRAIGNRQGIGWMQYYLAAMPLVDGVWQDGEGDAARALLRGALRLFISIHEPISVCYVLDALAFRWAHDAPEKAAVLWGASRRRLHDAGAFIEYSEATCTTPPLEAAQTALGLSVWESAVARGFALSEGDATAFALEEIRPFSTSKAIHV